MYEAKNPSTNLYKITLKLYIDCENGTFGAIQLDSTAFIGIYDAANYNLVDDYKIRRTGPVRLNKVNYKCVKPPTGICVDEYVYSFTTTIDPGANGKIISYQRCCRNKTINNLNNVEQTGITIWTKIPPATTSNNSAVFTNLPPNYVCLNAPFSMDHSATDIDGDSLVYSLNTPFFGGLPSDAKPEPSSSTQPPYNNVSWKAPYAVNYQMGGAPGLYINPTTGKVSVTPTTEGQFVVGITVKEYRNGQLVGETRRDYQINVIECVFDIVADYTIEGGTAVAGRYTFECRDTVFFKNRSYSKEPATYSWDFGDPTTDDDTSSLKDPYWVYPGNGDYDITLKVKSSICEDDYTYGVRIRSSKPFELGPDRVFCNEFTHRLSTNAPDAITTLWNTGQTGFFIDVKDTGTYSVTVSYGKCEYSDTVHLGVNFLPPFEIPKDSLFCEEVDMIVDVGVSGLNYRWSTSIADTNQSVHITEAGTYTVYVDNGDCFDQKNIRLWQARAPSVEDAFYCGEFDHPVDVGSFEEGKYLWSNNSTNRATSFTTGGNQWIQVTQRHCVNTDSFYILNPVIDLDLGPDEHFCDYVNKQLDAGENGVSFDWSTDQSDRIITAIGPGTYSVLVIDQYGCTARDTVTLTSSPSPTFGLGNDTTICLRSPTVLEAPEGYTAYNWNTGETERAIVVEEQGEYVATITDIHGCTGSDTLLVTVDPEALPNDLYIANAFSPNADNLNDLFPFQETIPQPGYYVAIFSRWGEKVFDSRTSETQNWDGFYKGEKVPNQTFIFYISFRGCDGNVRTKKGTVNPLY